MAKTHGKKDHDKKDKKTSKAKPAPVKAAPKKAAGKKAAPKPASKPAAKKPAKPILRKATAAPAKKAAAKPAPAKKPVAKKPAPSKPVKQVLKAVAKVVATVAKKAVEAAPAPKPTKAPKTAPAKPAKVEPVKEAKGPVDEVDESAAEALVDGEDELTDEEVVLTDAEGRRYCRVKDCDQISNVDGYCRYHYLALWKKIQVRKKILSEGKLERYIEELTARYPDKFLEMLRKDLRSEKEFLSAIQELEIDESAVDNEFEDEAQTYIDEVRGIEPAAREEEDF